MIRALVIVAVAGFFMAIVCFGAVAALGGPAVANGGWQAWADRVGFDWDDDNSYEYSSERVEGGGPEATKELTWSGGDTVEVMVAAEVRYTQGPETKITVSGPGRSVEHVVVDGERIRFDRRMRNAGRLLIVMTAPNINRFNLLGSQRLNIENYDHDELDVMIAGSGDVTAKGRARDAEVEINGSGDANLADLVAERVKIEIRGSGDATIAPTETADVEIAGSGDVVLLTTPEHVNQSIHGSGKVTHSARGVEPVAPVTPGEKVTPVTPVAPAPPAAKATKT
jgi:hypothetical protein